MSKLYKNELEIYRLEEHRGIHPHSVGLFRVSVKLDGALSLFCFFMHSLIMKIETVKR
jgi:hypothetical protein